MVEELPPPRDGEAVALRLCLQRPARRPFLNGAVSAAADLRFVFAHARRRCRCVPHAHYNVNIDVPNGLFSASSSLNLAVGA
jgi:hypothetical protein